MATRLSAPTDEELAEAERKIQENRDIEEFEANRAALEATRPKGAAKLSRARTFRISTPPLTRGPERAMPDDTDPERGPGEETPVDILRRANGRVAETATSQPKTKKKSRFEVPETRNASTIIKALGVVYVEERKADSIKAFQNLRDSIMMNLDVLLPAMPQIKQLFELLQIGEPERAKGGNGDGTHSDVKRLRRFLQGEPVEGEDSDE